jgi:hypothetical protein
VRMQVLQPGPELLIVVTFSYEPPLRTEMRGVREGFSRVTPATGTHDIVVTLPHANNYIHATAASDTGASQSGVPDASAHSNGSALTYSQSVTDRQ